MAELIDLTGKRFGRLFVVKRTNNDNRGQVRWLCKCDCGNTTEVLSFHLRNNEIKSCGCLSSELTIKRNKEMFKQYNNYDLSGEYGIGYTSKGEEFYFDLEDYDKIKDYCWCIDKYGYVVTTDNKHRIKMHILVMNNKFIDHINHKKYDNRKFNLRLVTNSQNQMNRNIGKNNTSGVKGVYWNNNKQKWHSQIVINKHKIHLGFFDDFNKATEIRKEAEEKYFGEYNFDNSMKDGDLFG